MRIEWKVLSVGLALAGAAGCGPKKQAVADLPRSDAASAVELRVADTDYARVSPLHRERIDQLRADLMRFEDQVARAKQGMDVADKRVALEQSRLDALKKEVDVAKRAVELARTSGDRQRLMAAEMELAKKGATVELQLANVDLNIMQRDQAKLVYDAALRAVALAQAEIEAAKVEALKLSGDAGADRYDPIAFDRQVENSRLTLQAAQRDMQNHISLIEQARDRVELARMRLERLEQQPVRGTDPMSPEYDPNRQP